MGAKTRRLTKEIKGLTKERDRALKKRVDAESECAEAIERGEASQEKILQLQSRNDFLVDILVTNSTAFIEAISKAKEAEANVKEMGQSLNERVAELVEQQKGETAQSTARNTKLQEELDEEKEARLWLISKDHDQRVKDVEEGQRRAEEAAVKIGGERTIWWRPRRVN